METKNVINLYKGVITMFSLVLRAIGFNKRKNHYQVMLVGLRKG